MAKQDPTAYHFGTALIPANYTICGVKLLPFSLGHYILLQQTYNPIVSNDVQEMPLADTLYWFFQAILICALPYEDNIAIMNDDKRWSELCEQFTVNLKKNMDADPSWNIYNKLKLFKDYINFYMDIPIYTEEKSSKKEQPSGTDWLQNIYLTFKKLGYKESEIINMNFRKLFYEWCSYAEAEGAIKVWNKMDLQSLARAKGLL